MDNLAKYTFRQYSDKYPRLFRLEKHKLKQILTCDAQVNHVGSTGVPGLGGKPIIDVFVAVRKKHLTKNKNRLQEIGYIFRLSGGSDQRLFFFKDYRYAGEVRRVHVHLTHNESFELIRALSVVDYLSKHPESVKEYSRVKQEAVNHANGDGKKYRAFKGEFLEELSRKAMSKKGCATTMLK